MVGRGESACLSVWKTVDRLVIGRGVDAPIGNRLRPMPDGRIDGTESRDAQAVEKGLFEPKFNPSNADCYGTKQTGSPASVQSDRFGFERTYWQT